MNSTRRRTIYVDSRVQGALLLRVAAYWSFCLLTIALTSMVWQILYDKPASAEAAFQRLFTQCAPALIGSFILLPLVLVDCVRMTNRIVGPMVRYRREMKNLVERGEAQTVELRDGDFWADFGHEFNRLVLATREGTPQGGVMTPPTILQTAPQ